MSTYAKMSKHPETGKWEPAIWMDDCYGSHEYGVRFRDGRTFKPEGIDTRGCENEAENLACDNLLFGKSEPLEYRDEDITIKEKEELNHKEWLETGIKNGWIVLNNLK